MSPKDNTKEWVELFQKHCENWDPGLQQRYLNIPNDPQDVDDEELASSKDLIQEVETGGKETG